MTMGKVRTKKAVFHIWAVLAVNYHPVYYPMVCHKLKKYNLPLRPLNRNKPNSKRQKKVKDITESIITVCNSFGLVRELSEEEKQMIILSEDFQRFMDRAGRIMERALAESVDIYTDYSGAEGDEGL